MPGRAATRPLRRILRARFGLWPLHELRNAVLGWPRALATWQLESAEVRRLAAAVSVPPARVTTVMPTYKRPESLVTAVRSALAQDVTDQTIIVVDDGGGLPELPADPRLVAVSLRHNTACLGMVRNVGIRLARSPYVAFLDDDNTWRPEHLGVALAALEAGADVVYTAVERSLPDGTPLDTLSTPFDRSTMADSSYVDANSIVVRSGRRVRFSRLPRSKMTLPKEDWEFVWRLSRHLRTVHVPVATVDYVANPSSYYTTWNDLPETTGDPVVGDPPGQAG